MHHTTLFLSPFPLFSLSVYQVPIASVDHKRVVSSREIQKEKVVRDMRMKTDILDLMDILPNSKCRRLLLPILLSISCPSLFCLFSVSFLSYASIHLLVSRDSLENLYAQYANIGPYLEKYDIVEKGLSKDIFQMIILRIFPMWKLDEYFMEQLFRVFDVNHDSNVDFKELISGLSVLCKGSNEEKLKSMFPPFFSFRFHFPFFYLYLFV
jgi:hypothetical protein